MVEAMHQNVVADMSRDEFYESMVKNIGKREDFSKLVTFGADALSEQEKLNIRSALAANGIALSLTDSDMGLTAIAYEIAARAVQLI